MWVLYEGKYMCGVRRESSRNPCLHTSEAPVARVTFQEGFKWTHNSYIALELKLLPVNLPNTQITSFDTHYCEGKGHNYGHGGTVRVEG